ncbi:hypothetical protein BC567DRAFT_224130 [Phyllosticta citribraziliensis]
MAPPPSHLACRLIIALSPSSLFFCLLLWVPSHHHSPCTNIDVFSKPPPPPCLFFCFSFPCKYCTLSLPPPSPLTPSGCHVPCGRVTHSCDLCWIHNP